jgi:hypothetical protein
MNYWANYNGPGRPITEEQIEELLSREGIKPRIAPDGTKYFHRDDFQEAFKRLGVRKK